MAKKKGKKREQIPQQQVDRLLRMKPEDLAVEAFREQNSIDALKQQMKEDDQIERAAKKVKAFAEDLEKVPAVSKAKEALVEVEEANRSEEHDEAILDLKALKQGWQADIKNRKKLLKFMNKTLKSHMESGALKFKD